MRLSKSQLAVIIALNVVIAGLLCFIFLFPQFDALTPPKGDNVGGNGPDMPSITEPYNKYREAIDGKTPDILRETQLMGSGDETVLGVYNFDGELYIFGNATVGDYDFDSYGGFLCIVDGNGKISYFGYFTGRMTAVTVAEGGFAVATVSEAGTSRERNILYGVKDRAFTEKAELTSTVLDIIASDSSRIAVVTKKSENCICLMEYVIGGEKWSRDRSTDISSGYALEYFDTFVFGNRYIISARASSLPRYDSIMFFEFEAGGDPTVHIYGGSGENLLQPYAVMPYSDGFMVLARRGGTATVIGIDYTFKSYKRDLLDFTFENARLVHDGKNYYACFITKIGSVTFALDGELKANERLTEFDGMTVEKAVGNLPLFFAKTNDALNVSNKSGENKISLEITGVSVYNCFINDDGTKTVVLSATGGNALSKPIGGKDIFIVQLK